MEDSYKDSMDIILFRDRQKQLGSELETAKEFYTVKDNWRETEEMVNAMLIILLLP